MARVKNTVMAAVMAAAVASAGLTGCKQPAAPAGEGGQSAAGGQAQAPVVKVESIDGAGASFPFPIYSQWAFDYEKVSGLKLNYQSIGSGGGIAQIKARTVDFGASDAPLESKELDESGLVQFPLVMGGVVPVYNIQGVESGKLKLTPDLLARIFLGEIKKWNDDAIEAENAGLTLPDKDITVVHRADGSGTTWIFTTYLDKVSPAWHEKVGAGKAVEWPTGIGGKGNEGVAVNVQGTDGAIGYVEFAYAVETKIPFAQLRNSAGQYVLPSIESFQASAANADWKAAPGFYMVLVDQPGDASWPISGASFILMHREQADPARAKAMLDFFAWCLDSGAEDARKLNYVPMPKAVADLVKESWRSQIASGGKPAWN